MGDHRVSKINAAGRANFVRHLLEDVQALEKMLADGMIEQGITRIGAEQEFCLVAEDFRPSLEAEAILAAIGDDHFTTELAKYNLEINLDPLELKGDCFRQMHQDLQQKLETARAVAAKFGNKPILAGILPSITREEFDLEYMTSAERYAVLNEMMRTARGNDFQLHINGVDELSLLHDSVLLEAACTSFQMHLQVEADDFVSAYNWAQALSGPILSVAVNSPLLLGRELWQETRIALFQQSIDIRPVANNLKQQEPRVAFGTDWARGTVADIFKNDIARHTFLVTKSLEQHSLESLAQGKAPKLEALNLHNGTIYRWNRACYGVGGGKPHLRIENRYIPAGPSTADEMANFVLWVGLMKARPKRFDDMPRAMDFRDARGNFIKAARYGLESVLVWENKSWKASDLLLEELLPLARKGLQTLQIDGDDIDYYLGIIAKRCQGQTGASWCIKNYRHLCQSMNKDNALLQLTEAMYNNQASNEAVHDWSAASPSKEPSRSGQLRHLMSNELFTVHQDDLASLATSIMQWKNIHHIPVVDDAGQLKGLLTWSHMQAYQAQGNSSEQTVATIMEKDLVVGGPDTPIHEGTRLMEKHHIGCLPIVEGEQLLGIVTRNDMGEVDI